MAQDGIPAAPQLLNDLVKYFVRAQTAASSRFRHGLANICINADLQSHVINMIGLYGHERIQ